MGEVYRADDLKLGQPVALKFLPTAVEKDRARLDRFLNEVKIARQVAHPNVCRVYDVSEVDGHHFISMEFVDGEDLASLLRQIGRLPEEKATQIARQICAGLAAAHEKGIIHRDLKPANVMIDGRGRIRITDFGLAVLADAVGPEDVFAGTPAYMAPEQLGGEEVTVRSDVYSLGLVLYELFTGKRAFEGTTPAEIRKLREESTPTAPSSHVDGLDHSVERAILRCLEREPAQRPASVLTIAASLPGGDPLAAALAAGETPSPELVAAAGGSDVMHPAFAVGLAVITAVLFFSGSWLSSARALRDYASQGKPPMVLADRAREVIGKLGYTDPIHSSPVDTAFGYSVGWDRVDRIPKDDYPPDQWTKLQDARPGIVSFWYRQKPSPFRPSPEISFSFLSIASNPVSPGNPYPQMPGEIGVTLDHRGRLEEFFYIPKSFSGAPVPSGSMDWSSLFELADLDMTAFDPVEPGYQSYMVPDSRAAWVGARREAPEEELRVEAGALNGRPVFFVLLGASDTETLAEEPTASNGFGLSVLSYSAPIMVLILVSCVLARRNVKKGRADRRGAWILATFVFLTSCISEALQSHLLYTTDSVFELHRILGSAVFAAIAIGAAYLALEPYARRVWPSLLVSWSRLTTGTAFGWKDPVVGRAILVGTASAATILFAWGAAPSLSEIIRGRPVTPVWASFDELLGQRQIVAHIADGVLSSMNTGFQYVLMLLGLRLVLRRTSLAIVVFLLYGVASDGGSVMRLGLGIGAPVSVVTTAIVIAVLLRFGLVGLFVTMFAISLGSLATTRLWTGWHAQPAITALVVFLALTAYGCWVATSGFRIVRQKEPG